MSSYRDLVYERYASVIKRYPEKFDTRAAEAWGAAFRRYLHGWLPHDRQARVVDLGCGSGRMLHLLAQLGFRNVVGVDISAEQVALARQVNDRVLEKDVLSFLRDRPPGSFDLVIALDLIEHFTKDEAMEFLDQASQSLAAGGRLILNTPNAASPLAGARRYGDFTHEIGFSPSCLSQILELFGLERPTARELGPYPHGMVSACRTAMWQVLRLGLQLYNLIEIGHRGDNIFTRDFVISAVKPSAAAAAA